MKNKILMGLLAGAFLSSGYVFANEGQEHKMSDGTMMKGMTHEEAVEVGNKICPVSGEEVGTMGEIVKHEHNGKIYNLCCSGCVKEFQKDPAKYSKIADEAATATKEK